MQGVSLQPALPPQLRTTFGIHKPTDTHYRPASCAEVDCADHTRGWTTRVLTGSDDERLLQRAMSGRVDRHRRRAIARPDGGFMVYAFPAGQPCLKASSHRVTLDRPPIHIIRGGDHRLSFDEQQVSGEQWINEFGDHQGDLARAVNGSPS